MQVSANITNESLSAARAVMQFSKTGELEFAEVFREPFEAVSEPVRWPAVLRKLSGFLALPCWEKIEPNPRNRTTHDVCGTCRHAIDQFRRSASLRKEHDPLVRALCDHVDRAMGLCSRLNKLEIQETALLQAFDRLDRGLLLLDRDGRIIFGNSVAQAILDERDGLWRAADHVHASKQEENKTLRETIANAAIASGQGTRFDSVLALSRPSLRRALSLVITSVIRTIACKETSEVAGVVICDPERPIQLDASVLAHVYALTKAEAAVTAKLLQGEALEGVANALFISIETVRTHLKRIFLKTGTNRQSQLIALVLNQRV